MEEKEFCSILSPAITSFTSKHTNNNAAERMNEYWVIIKHIVRSMRSSLF